MNNKTNHLIIYLIFAVLMTAPVAAYGDVFNDAYSYEDDFQNALGLDMTVDKTNGFAVSDGKLVSNVAGATAVSKCISLTQPNGSSFEGWSCLKISLEDAGEANTLYIETCKGEDLKTVAIYTGDNTIDLSKINADTIRLKWETQKKRARADSWKVYGKAQGATTIDIFPDTIEPKAGDTVTFTIRMASSGAKTRNPVLRFSLDDINGGLAEDAAYRPLAFVSASNGPNSEAPKMIIDDKEVPIDQAAGVTSGVVIWHLQDMPDGFSDNVSVVLKIPRGYMNGATLGTRATLDHGLSFGACSIRMIEAATSELVTVNSQNGQVQVAYTPFTDVGPGAISIFDRYSTYNRLQPDANHSDVEDVTFTITGIGDCTPLFNRIDVSNPYPYQVQSTPEKGMPITADNPVKIHFDRIDFDLHSACVEIYYDVPETCGGDSEIGTQSEIKGDYPEWEEIDSIFHKVVYNTCRQGKSIVHRVMSGNKLGNYLPWPDYNEYYICEINGLIPKKGPGSLRAGEYFTTWTPYGNEENRTHTIPLDRSYNLTEIPEGVTFHGVPSIYGLTRLYKDCTGKAPAPTDDEFDHEADPPHLEWKPVYLGEWSAPFSNPPDENDPKAVAPPGCRLLGVKYNDNPAWMGTDYGNWKPTFLWRVCDGRFTCTKLDEGTEMSLIGGGHIYTYETVTDPEGAVHDCDSYDSKTVYKESKSWPKVYAWPEQDKVFAGKTAHIILNPENQNHASQYVDGRWVINLFVAKDFIDLEKVEGEILTDGLEIPEQDQNVEGESCDNIAEAIKFNFSWEKCRDAGSVDEGECMAWWEVPPAFQPPNGWGYRESGNPYHDDYVPIYRFRLKAPIWETAPANTMLNFVAEVRTNDLTARGADNAVADTDRWSDTNFDAIASVSVLETPGLDITTTGPVNRKKGDLFTHNLELENIGNTRQNDWYVTDLLPKEGVNATDFTPEYRKIYIDRPATDVIAEYSTVNQCFAEPLGVKWFPILEGFQTTSGDRFQSETRYNINAEARCIRLRKNPDSQWNFNPGDKILSAIEFQIPGDASEGQRICNRALAGTSSDIDPVETVNVCTEVNDAVFVEVEKTYKRHPKGVEWTITVENRSGTIAKNITVTDDLPDRSDVSYGGIVEGSLPDGWSVIEQPDIGDSGGQLVINIPLLSPDDGNPGSGFDEGNFSVVSSIDNPFGITNCVTVEPEGGMGSESKDCITVEKGNLIFDKIQIATDRASGTDETELFPGDEFSYVITVTNDSESLEGVFLKITDTLDDYLDYVKNSFTVNGAAKSGFTDGTLNYSEMIDLGETLTLKFKVKVNPDTPHGHLIENRATVKPCINPDDSSVCYPEQETPVVYARVVDTRCDFNLRVRANRVQVQPTWTHNGTAPYDLYRRAGTDTDFRRIATVEDIQWVMATYLDRDVKSGYTYDYYVVNRDGCQSEIQSIRPELLSDGPEFINQFEYIDNPITTDDQDADNTGDGSDSSETDNNLIVDDTSSVSGVNYTPLPPEPDPSPLPVPIYRLYSPTFNRHHYCDEYEANYLLTNYPEVWTLEAAAFYAYRNADNGTAPVYRLYNERLREHLFTMDANEKDTLVNTYENSWKFEGVAFYVDPEPADGTVPVWRLYSDDLQTHLLTTDVNEKERLLTDGWHDEGVAYYVYATN